jgi:hypothetical protein
VCLPVRRIRRAMAPRKDCSGGYSNGKPVIEPLHWGGGLDKDSACTIRSAPL